MSDKNDPIVVTGANGNVGSLVAEALLKSGIKVRAGARDMYKLRKLRDLGADVFESNFTDASTLTKAFTGAKAVFVLTPLPILSKDLNGEQYDNINGIIRAIKDSGVTNVVLLSSWGTELPSKSGGILGCRYFEMELEKLPGLNVVLLRPVWFMENFIYNIGLMKVAGINGAAIDPDVKFPMVDTRDIAVIATSYLRELNFRGRTVHYICGPREYSMKQVTAILGNAIGRPDMQYVEFPPSVMKKGMVDSGQLSANAADMLIEINQCISSGMLSAEARSAHNTTSTTLEEFARSRFAPAYKSAKDPTVFEKIPGLFLKAFLKLAGKRMVQKEKTAIA